MFDKAKEARDQRLHKESENIRHNELITQSIQTQETILRAFSSLVNYLDTKVGRTEVVNQLKQIGTPDALRVVEAVDSLHETLKTHENTDLTEVQTIMQQVLDEVKLLPKQFPEQKDITFPEEQDYSTQFEAMIGIAESIEQAIKAQETTVQAPVVNVDAPIVKVDAPDLKPLEKQSKQLLDAIKGIAIPAQIQTDITPLLREQKRTNKLLEEMPIGGGGGGGLAVPYELIDGAVPVTSGGVAAFQVNDIEDAATSYFGFTKTNGEYMIKEVTDTSVYYATISNNGAVTSYTDAWANRATLTYGRFDQAF